MIDLDAILHEMKWGSGIATVQNFLSDAEISEAVAVAKSYRPDRYGTVRCLLDKSDTLTNIVGRTELNEICLALFGKSYTLGTFDIKITSPTTEDEEEIRDHVDYPGSLVTSGVPGTNNPYFGVPLALKAFIPLTDLTEISGATTYVPGSQLWHRDPELEPGRFEELMETGHTQRLEIKAGTLALWAWPVWHADLANRGDANRLLMHICFTAPVVARPQDIRKMYPTILNFPWV